ncbi:MAG: prevent-host-death protein [Candidatus Raymondbacteria bacterium RifOxyA12_full_50_37]|uniref:Antitoxin n=1 Tax=Candidatus Raymondbacteria bacterium RIFOXYD12_FULL_49_13 TaxID=1817890 RepID=A0A1F7FBN8_UNCRA|nr:MAG: prevent-host-death protein [Candidatus Raymondbacteria bacterium RifOxyA12_full_50_37]OGJ88995.1 MAG: prevent-host-death protein [Candidatus Raymondbacteria bacterium RIFOXYA2_FULL_49_16]OGJ92504.1 MAG: prevent-host-death protein [Candidatus Raymondbacteria bacterium RifOxyB12_full_50_8]OGJ97023.1 MAG: prevent-host-death protein [Candidatus Raymondbacteria bacterium RIFOXYC2_FULL_50_21]OGK04021.1 MAG: prevent-host-death protein [Candidatus Raymondbacteria bacterium RIFOXYD12_FULL_49_13]
MHTVTVHQAKTNLSRLLQEAQHGEEIIISRGKTPIAKLVALPSARANRRIGSAPGLVLSMTPDFQDMPAEFRDYVE